MKIIITKDYDEMSKVAAKLVLDVVKNNSKAVLGLATGSTPLGLYNELIKDHMENNTSYKDVHTVNLDEYMGLDITSDQSYVYFMRKNLLDSLEIPKENSNIENGKALDQVKECERYNKILDEYVPDIQVLGIGSNGHIAFNEPGTSFDSVTHVVELKESTIKDNSRLFNSIDEVPRKAYTMGLKNIMNSKSIIILASGKNKSEAVKKAIEGELTIDLPASILRNHDDCTFIIDKDASSLLDIKCIKNKNIYVEGKGIIKTNLSFNNYIISTTESIGENLIDIEDDSIIVPGFIDEHIHGANGSDVMDSTIESIDNISMTLAKEGTTSFLATTMTMDDDSINKSLNNISKYYEINKNIGSRLLGAHLEGPFISSKFKGAQKEDFIIEPSINKFIEYKNESNNLIKIVSLAIEEDKDYKLVKYLNDNNIVPSVGHSNAKEEDVKCAIKYGLKSVTHTYNAQSPLHHREIGVVGSAFLYDELNTELIADLIHVSVPAIKLLFKTKPNDKITLITDSIRAKGIDGAISELGGQTVYINNNEARLSDGTLAGSILKMNDAIKNLVNYCDVSLTNAIDCATINPAKNLKLDNIIGSIKEGKKADFTILSKNFEILMTIRDGNIIYKKINGK